MSIKWQNVIILLGITINSAKTLGGSKDAVPCLIKLQAGHLPKCDIAQEQVM